MRNSRSRNLSDQSNLRVGGTKSQFLGKTTGQCYRTTTRQPWDAWEEQRNAFSKIQKKVCVRKISKTEKKPIESCYLPHLSVIRPDKATTETSIVCDASAKCEGISLSDVIHQGPKLKRELFSVLIRFHKQAMALVCCIAEVYLHISLTPEDS